jgi:bifunctional non-homologous end joining protein LigD
MADKPHEKRENWLLIKSDNATARSADDPDILEARPESVKTGRLTGEVAGDLPGKSTKAGPNGQPHVRGAKKAAIVDGRQPEGLRLEALLGGFPVGWEG